MKPETTVYSNGLYWAGYEDGTRGGRGPRVFREDCDREWYERGYKKAIADVDQSKGDHIDTAIAHHSMITLEVSPVMAILISSLLSEMAGEKELPEGVSEVEALDVAARLMASAEQLMDGNSEAVAEVVRAILAKESR